MPPEVAAAYRTDVFVREVNSGGIFGFIDWEPNLVKPTVKDLETIGAAKQAKVLQSAIAMLKLKTWPPSEGELDTAREKIWDDAAASDRFDKLSQEIIDDSGILAGLTHDYIRRHIEVFK